MKPQCRLYAKASIAGHSMSAMDSTPEVYTRAVVVLAARLFRQTGCSQRLLQFGTIFALAKGKYFVGTRRAGGRTPRVHLYSRSAGKILLLRMRLLCSTVGRQSVA
jgi:hypothetical protein